MRGVQQLSFFQRMYNQSNQNVEQVRSQPSWTLVGDFAVTEAVLEAINGTTLQQHTLQWLLISFVTSLCICIHQSAPPLKQLTGFNVVADR